MQNRFTIRPVPSSVDLDRLREYIEDRSTWIDRIAVLRPERNDDGINEDGCGYDTCSDCDGCGVDRRSVLGVVGVELSVENYRDGIVHWFNENRDIELKDGDGDGEGEDQNVEDLSRQRSGAGGGACFSIDVAAPMTKDESDALLRVCPIVTDLEPRPSFRLGKYGPLNFRLDSEMGGTGAKLWRGGILLAEAIGGSHDTILPPDLFRGRAVIELGAGSVGLPSLTLAKLCDQSSSSLHDRSSSIGGGDKSLPVPRPSRITVTDSVDEAVCSLRSNVCLNGLEDIVSVNHMNFYCVPEGKRRSYDLVMYADTVYSVEQGLKLAEACEALLKPGCGRAVDGTVDLEVGVLSMLPPFRVGVAEHVAEMGKIFGKPEEVDLSGVIQARKGLVSDISCVQGGSGQGYRLLKWSLP